MQLSAEAQAAILRKVAALTLGKARTAWKKARDSPTEKRVRAAFYACVLASRTLRKAAAVTPGQATEMLAEAGRIDVEAKALNAQLARIVEG